MSHFKGMSLDAPRTVTFGLVVTVGFVSRSRRDWTVFYYQKGWLRLGPFNLNWRFA